MGDSLLAKVGMGKTQHFWDADKNLRTYRGISARAGQLANA
jgi:hypothetical protein